MLYAHLSQPAPSTSSLRPDLPSRVDDVISVAMAKAPEDRYASCLDMIEDLRALGQEADPITPTERGRRALGGSVRTDSAMESSLSRGSPSVRPDRPLSRFPPRVRRRGWWLAWIAGLLALTAPIAVVTVRNDVMRSSGRHGLVVLPFAAESYQLGGLRVFRTWTLSGADATHLHAVLRVVASKPARTEINELIPREMVRSLSDVRFTRSPRLCWPTSTSFAIRSQGQRESRGRWPMTHR